MLITYFAYNWRYSNAPEGQKPLEKVIGLSKYGFAAGLGVGLYDCTLLSQAYTFWPAVNCVSYWMLPFTAMCATFASVAYMTTKLRGKDGYANYVTASLATTGVFYHWQKNGKLTFPYGTLLLILAMVKKHGDLIGWNPMPLNIFETGPSQHTTIPVDWTIIKDPRGPKPWE
ncbi:PREDICTED: uncharacterized protein LOC106745200 [Dinoponera quadriceps]|uniref:NADH dehydrogenase [ubiquinone] 1 alpha subcomplex subunit 11 n=1 Tax=Dinoponera quadriceps TaxID=609295 RepID=A0A6P3XCK9_DINQU|nr:PREDICTED: uncharacterized protein LOC106745200 [Dinoponera quadriceps]XP_014476048.1 PREDICTED: uncharacterized protein LOC106745200 [Dinoponera quadriceps]XP_014476049.1 PREDICTED: uncharacterized protein LOC106745200 [Dinoponera quadriceps]XP_014476050.1 PREDICTED: uncharacterized protein LOC106745200 [Dinoponera quadriceps]